MVNLIRINKEVIKGIATINGRKHLVIDDHYHDTLKSFGFKKIYRYSETYYPNDSQLRTNSIAHVFMSERNLSGSLMMSELFLRRQVYYIKSNASNERLTYMKLALS